MKKIRALPVVPGGIEAGLLGPTERFLAVCVETFPQLGWLDRFYHGSRTWGDGPFPRWFEDWLNCVEVGPDRGAEGVLVRIPKPVRALSVVQPGGLGLTASRPALMVNSFRAVWAIQAL